MKNKPFQTLTFAISKSIVHYASQKIPFYDYRVDIINQINFHILLTDVQN